MGVSLPGGGGKRGVDFDINLVPFIDLLSCLISFLLVTAVWTQVSQIDVNQPPPNPGEPPDTPQQEPREIRILIDKEGYIIHLPTEGVPRRIGLDGDGTTYKRWELESALKKAHESDSSITKVKFGAADDAHFKEYIGVLDVCLGLGLTDLQPTVAADLAQKLMAQMQGGAAPPSAP